jgi:hypothetical protein
MEQFLYRFVKFFYFYHFNFCFQIHPHSFIHPKKTSEIKETDIFGLKNSGSETAFDKEVTFRKESKHM